MAMTVFPSYARLLMEGFLRHRDPNVDRTDMESGPAKQAPRASKGMVTDTCTYGFDTKQQYLDFIAWWEVDLARGAKWFLWTDPVDGLTKKARIPGGALDEEKTHNRAFSRWTVKMRIERWI